MDFVKQNVFIIFDKITWNNENGGEDNLMVYVYDGDYLKVSLCKELINMSKEMSSNWFAINHVCNSDSSVEACQKHIV